MWQSWYPSRLPDRWLGDSLYRLEQGGYPFAPQNADCGSSAQIGRCDGKPRRVGASGEIVAANRLVERVRFLRYHRYAGPARRRADTAGLDERAQDRQRQIGVAAFDRLIEPFRQLALAR